MVVWDDTKDKQLLLILIDLTPEEQAGKKWEVVAAKMGEGYTGEAIRQHLKKIRTDFAKEGGGKGNTNGNTSPIKPKVRKRAKKETTSDAVKKEQLGEDDVEAAEESPKKKSKKKGSVEE